MKGLALVGAMALALVVAAASLSGVGGGAGLPPIMLGGTPLGLVGTPGSLWVLTCDRRCSGEGRRSVGRIVRIDTPTGRVQDAIAIDRPGAFAVAPGGSTRQTSGAARCAGSIRAPCA